MIYLQQRDFTSVMSRRPSSFALHFLWLLSFLSCKAVPWSHREDSAPKVDRRFRIFGWQRVRDDARFLEHVADCCNSNTCSCATGNGILGYKISGYLQVGLLNYLQLGVGFPESSQLRPCVARELCAHAAGEFHPQQSWVGQCNPEKNQDHGALPWCPSHSKSIPFPDLEILQWPYIHNYDYVW